MSIEVPDLSIQPSTLSAEDASTGVRSRVSTRRVGVGLFILGFGATFATFAIHGALLAAKIAILAPDEKIFYLGLATAVGGVATSIGLFFWGAVSDQTRSRFGSRTPWIIIGGIACVIGLVLTAVAQTIPTFIAAYMFYNFASSAIAAAAIAIFPDRVPSDKRGRISAVYGAAQVLSGSVAGIISSRFIGNPEPMFLATAAALPIFIIVFLVVAPDFSNKGQPRSRLDLSGVKAAFKFPAGAPDFYWAFAGRFLLLFGLYVVQSFTLYILTDYIGLENDAAANVIALSGLASLVTIVIGTLVGGPLSDRIGRRKPPIFVASLLFGVAVLIPFLWPTSAAMIVFAALSGLGLGCFLSVDTALMTEVLPSEESRGKDLGILYAANTVPQIIAPLATAAIVAIGFGYGPVFVVAFILMMLGAFSVFKIKSVR